MLLLFAIRMIRTGIERAGGHSLRSLIIGSSRNALANALSGMISAAVLQSSTAAALLVCAFAVSGVLTATSALVVVLGADLGSALTVQFLSLNLQGLVPALMALGGFLFLKAGSNTSKQVGRVLLGIGFVLISLRMIGEATGPLRESHTLATLIGAMSGDGLTGFLFGALLAFVFHSSVATILLFAALCAQGVLPIESGIPLVLGANAGGGLLAVWLTRGSDVLARRITAGNMMFRGVGALVVLVLLPLLLPYLTYLGTDPARQIVNVHFAFNLALLIVCMPLVPLALWLAGRMIPQPGADGAALLQPVSALDTNVLHMPSLALASAKREILRMSDTVEIMFAPIMDFFVSANPEQVARIQQLDADVNKSHTAIKIYIANLSQGELSPEEAKRAVELTGIAVSLERVGDIIAKELLPLTLEKHERGFEFSKTGWRELKDLHARVMTNMQIALNILVSEDAESARRLVEEKERFRSVERESYDKHLERLGSKVPESIASSNVYLETIRALKEINSRFVTFAYPILEKEGILLRSRLAARVKA